MRKEQRSDIYAILAFILISSTLTPFYELPAFIGGDDLISHLSRAFLFYKSVGEGVLYPRVADHASFLGYPVYNFRPPLLHFLWLLPLFIYKSPLFTTFFIFFCGFFLSMLAFYLSFKRIFGRPISFLGAIFYGLYPYHIIDAYYRTALAEFLAFVWIPPFVKACYEHIHAKSRKSGLLLSVMLALLVLSHNITALYVMVLCALWAMWSSRATERQSNRAAEQQLKDTTVLLRYRATALSQFWPFALGLGLSAFYWLPAMVEFRYIDPNILKFPVTKSLLSFKELFYIGSPLTFELSKLSLVDSITACLPLVIGAPYIIFLAMLILGLFHSDKRLRGLSIFLTLSSIALIFLMTPLAAAVWLNIKPIRIFQYAWRFLVWLGFAASIGFCVGISTLAERIKLSARVQRLVGIIALAIVCAYAASFYVVAALWRSDEGVRDIPRLNKAHMFDPIDDWHRDFIPRWVDLADYQSKPNALISSGSVETEVTKRDLHKLDMNLTAAKDTNVVMNILYFPGWKLKIDGRSEKVKISERGFLQFSVPSGEHKIELRFRPTPIRFIAFFVSLVSLAIIMWLILGKFVGLVSVVLAVTLSVGSFSKGIATFEKFPPMPEDKISYRWACEIDADENFIVASVPKGVNESHVYFDNKIKFIGYRYSVDRGKGNGFLNIELYWRCLLKMDKDYMLFVLFEPKDNARNDFGMSHQPVCWTYKTSQWREGEIIRESYKLAIDGRLLGKSYTMKVGVLDESANQFLPVRGLKRDFFKKDIALR